MTALGFDAREEPSQRSEHGVAVHVQPLPGLEWSRAIELPGGVWVAGSPAGIRRAWIHRAPEDQVLAMYRATVREMPALAAPWWLRALADGGLASRKGGFAVEDAIAALLAERPGWVYVPWVGFGEDGYWEFVPSERAASTGSQTTPTTVQFTHRHPGWIDVIPAHSHKLPEPLPIDGTPALAARLTELEAL